jgi:two-component system, chemotaxis family, chemotaxis protein CheY
MIATLPQNAAGLMASPRHVLVVDDYEDWRILLDTLLTRAGFAITQAENGEAALQLMPATGLAALVTDLQMPIVDGLALTLAVRQLPGYAHLPVLMLTSSEEDDPRITAARRLPGVRVAYKHRGFHGIVPAIMAMSQPVARLEA